MATSLVPYLFFQGNCKQAVEFYQSVFGGELTVQTIGDLPADTPKMEDSKDSDVMHASLKGGEVELMASDSLAASPKAAKIELCVNGSDEATMSAIFEKLSDGGEVKQALTKQFWGDTFGQLRDKFGIDWMINIATA